MIKKREETTRERVDKENNIQIKFDQVKKVVWWPPFLRPAYNNFYSLMHILQYNNKYIHL